MMCKDHFLVECFKRKLFLLCAFILVSWVPLFATTMPTDEVDPPLPIEILAQASHSVTLSWRIPEHPDTDVFVTKISIRYSSSFESEKEITLSGNQTSKLINNLRPGTNYSVYVTAHYSNNRSASSGKFITSTLGSMNSLSLSYKDCLCDPEGTKICEKSPNGAYCVCIPGYEGSECSECADKYYRQGKQCKPCSCPENTSIGTCHLGSDNFDPQTIVMCQCKPPYSGADCDICAHGYFRTGNTCISCNELLVKNCLNCSRLELNESEYLAAAESCKFNTDQEHHQRTVVREDGTVAIIAVVTCLAFIGCVAGFITCYRHRMQSHNQPPFWSIELAEDKISLNASNDYRRLGGVSKSNLKSFHQRSSSVVEATVAQRAADQPQYNCISI